MFDVTVQYRFIRKRVVCSRVQKTYGHLFCYDNDDIIVAFPVGKIKWYSVKRMEK